MIKTYHVKITILKNKNKYKAKITKDGYISIILCASSDKKAIELLEKVVCIGDKRKIKNSKKVKDFVLQNSNHSYMFALRIENVDSYIQDCDHK